MLRSDSGLEGYGLTFTIGKGNDIGILNSIFYYIFVPTMYTFCICALYRYMLKNTIKTLLLFDMIANLLWAMLILLWLDPFHLW